MRKQPDLALDAAQIDATVLTILGEQAAGDRNGTSEPIKAKRRGRKRKDTAESTPPNRSAEGEPRPAKRGRGRPSLASTSSSTSSTSSSPSSVVGEVTSLNSSPTCTVDSNGIVCNAARERSRVKTLRDAFLDLQRSLPSVPPDTKLSKLDVLVLATTYIAHLMKTLDGDANVPELGALLRGGREPRVDGESDGSEQAPNQDHKHRLKAHGYLHPVKKWPMRSRLYAGALLGCVPNAS